ncbi:hypothetical protein [Tritonibacter horizontis]|uniref:Uncharacterized protein n=1 Tax=Tritonibacter horizontis TaxID=1768241 RepID=A0A132BQE2_9RHOB|nr:hypothetical protein [Tritonibacter horizontis]KUP90611.1 hypothetical protein TRIHO_44770 [Tritonibacter horizontis]
MIRLALPMTLALVLISSAAVADRGFAGRKGWNLQLNDDTTNSIVEQLKRDFRTCQNKPKVYRYDCYRRSYRTGAQELNGSREYGPVAEALALVEKRIGAAVQANLDPSQPPLRDNIFIQHRAVKPEALPLIKQATLAAMEEATTILLRTPDNEQQKHFQRVAAVIQSNKVLLRSALLALPRPMIRLAQMFAPSLHG